MKKLTLFLIGMALMITASSASALQLSVGTWGDWATVGFHFNDKVSGYLGYSYNGNTKVNWMLAKVDVNLAKIKDVQTKAGIAYYTTSPNNGSSLGLTLGASVMVLPNASIGGDIMLADFNTSAGGANTTDILPTALMSFNLYL
ncbi:MAG: hypothetical protein NT099_02060 [Candidatus Saganbacteria bacterium]|nr:hypothetical protein [Candidatus Saganbacteria bacterium]